MSKILITGSAGFIGYHLAKRLIERGAGEIVGLDNLNDYYDVNLKNGRLSRLLAEKSFRFLKLDLSNRTALPPFFEEERFDKVVHLGAQPGVRYSLSNPALYIDSNIVGFGNVLEGCRHSGVRHLIFASSSSVYGANTRLPFSVHDAVDHPVSLYAATKRATELMAHCYAHLYRLPCTGLRFFTVYGPWGRPDMAPSKFTKAILEGKPIDLYNNGHLRRDFTYIDDIVEGLERIMQTIPQPDLAWDSAHPDPASSSAPYRLYNIGNQNSVELLRFIEVLEETLGQKAQLNPLPMQPGDVQATYADVEDLVRDFSFSPRTPLEEGVKRFVEWYRTYYQ